MSEKPPYEELKQRVKELEEEAVDLKQANEILRNNERRFIITAKETGQLLYSFDPRTGRVKWAGAIEVVTGYTYEEYQSFDACVWGEQIHPDDREMVLKAMSEALEHHTRFDFEYRFRRKDGSYIFVEEHGAFVPDSKSTPYPIVGTISDITKRKKTEEALQESEERFKAQYHGSPTPTFTWQKQGDDFVLIDFNDAARAISEGKVSDFVGSKAIELYKDRQELVRDLLKCNDGREMIKRETRSEHFVPDRLVAVTFTHIPPDLVVVHLEDITERKQAEEALKESEKKYRNLFENLYDIYYSTDGSGIITLISPSVEKYFGYKPDEIIGLNIKDFYVDPNERAGFLKILISDGYVNNFEAQLRRKDNSVIWLSTNAKLLQDDEGNFSGLEGITRDITERKRMEAEKIRLETQLQQAQKLESIGTLAGGIAHDFNNILSPIMVHSELSMMDLPPESPIQHNLNQIFKAGERARDLVKQILTFGRMREGQRAPIRVTPLIKEDLKMIRASIPTTIEIKPHLDAENDIVLADPAQFHQILLNLCTNAAHAMKEKGGILEIAVSEEDLDLKSLARYSDLSADSFLRLAVKDTGHGMDHETVKRIFEPYYTTKGVGEGTGLGLSVVHGIVKSYGGDIFVESTPGKGTTFEVFLPKAEVDPHPIEQRALQLPKGNERILFVDDEKDAVYIIQAMLERLGYRVTARTSSIEALEVFRRKPEEYDLVITDMTMPNMTGKGLAKELMAIRQDIPIILCTGFSEQIDEKKAMHMGIRAFVLKPIVMRQIANTIREVLDKK